MKEKTIAEDKTRKLKQKKREKENQERKWVKQMMIHWWIMFQTVAMIIIPVNTFQFIVWGNKHKMDIFDTIWY